MLYIIKTYFTQRSRKESEKKGETEEAKCKLIAVL